jgi:multidrug efflux system outer membrane protein
MRRFLYTHAPRLLAAAALSLLGACAVGPDYHRPGVVTPPNYGWKVAEPSDELVRGDWWMLFHDAELTRSEKQATSANQLLQTAIARVDEARAIARVTVSRFFPQASFDPSVSRFRTQFNHVPSELTATNFALPLDFSYEVDLWGKVRRSLEANRAQADASLADFHQVLLTLRADVATNYFVLRQLDAQIEILRRTLALRETAVNIVKQRFEAGLAPEADVDRARTEVSQSKTTIIEIERQRSVMQDAIALLCGQPAPGFKIERGSLHPEVPAIPVGLPSQLLERRPDIASAERKMAAANAQIGVAKAAFFPVVTITGDAGYSSFHASTLLDWQSRLFQMGPGVALPLLNGGRLSAGLKQAHANYEAVCASYRQQVLAGLREVSDALVDMHSYEEQVTTEKDAVASSTRAAKSSAERYQQGLVPYFDVLDSERTQLQTEIQLTQLIGQRLVASVRLIKAIGGGYEQEQAPAKPNPAAPAAGKGHRLLLSSAAEPENIGESEPAL